jgi:hypothetical protein
MTITNGTTIGELQLELAKLGVNNLVWQTYKANHVVTLSGSGQTPELQTDITGCGKTFLEALDDAMTSLYEAVRADLYKAS